jgi:hypothetical protein
MNIDRASVRLKEILEGHVLGYPRQRSYMFPRDSVKYPPVEVSLEAGGVFRVVVCEDLMEKAQEGLTSFFDSHAHHPLKGIPIKGIPICFEGKPRLLSKLVVEIIHCDCNCC